MMLYRITAVAHISIAIYFHGHFISVTQRSLEDTLNSGVYSREFGSLCVCVCVWLNLLFNSRSFLWKLTFYFLMTFLSPLPFVA